MSILNEAMAYLADKSQLISTMAGREASLIVNSANSVCSLLIMPKNISPTTPAVELDVQGSNGSIVIYTDTGSGWQYKRTI